MRISARVLPSALITAILIAAVSVGSQINQQAAHVREALGLVASRLNSIDKMLAAMGNVANAPPGAPPSEQRFDVASAGVSLRAGRCPPLR